MLHKFFEEGDWFAPKTLGYGAGWPIAWQGWALLASYLCVMSGLGLMLGIKLKSDSRAFVAYLRTKGLLTVAAGDNVVRVLPPLNIDESHVREFVERLSAAAAEYEVPAAAA